MIPGAATAGFRSPAASSFNIPRWDQTNLSLCCKARGTKGTNRGMGNEVKKKERKERRNGCDSQGKSPAHSQSIKEYEPRSWRSTGVKIIPGGGSLPHHRQERHSEATSQPSSDSPSVARSYREELGRCNQNLEPGSLLQ